MYGIWLFHTSKTHFIQKPLAKKSTNALVASYCCNNAVAIAICLKSQLFQPVIDFKLQKFKI